MKKLMSVILSAIMIVVSVPFTSFAVTYVTEGYFTYYVSNSKAVLTAVDQSLTGNITIPDTLGGYPVVSIGPDTFRGRKNITGVKLPYSVTSISNGAFDYCIDLVSIRIPDGVKTIYDITFYGCKSLESVYLGKGVTTIGEKAFVGCENLKYITVTDKLQTVGEESFYNCRNMTLIIEISDMKNWCENDSIPNIYITGDGIYPGVPRKIISINDEYMTEIVIPEGTKKIRRNAFNNCIEVTDFTIPDSVESIDHRAFYNTAYYNNKSNWDADGVLYIDNHLIEAKESISGEYIAKDGTVTVSASAFSNCEELTAVTLPDSLKGIGNSAFYNTTKLSSITLPDKPLRIEEFAFTNSAYYVNSDNRENNVLYIGNHLIADFELKSEYTVKDGTYSIAGNAFYYFKKVLNTIVIPKSVKIIEKEAFYYQHVNDVFYGGTKEDWDNILIEECSYGLYRANMHYNTTSPKDHYECTVLTEPTCDTDGTGSFTCPCGFTYTGVIPGGHDYVYHDGIAPTCTEDGFAPYTTCTRCDYSSYLVLPGGHDTVFNPGKSPTCTEPGYSAYATCTRCNYNTYKESPSLGHDTVQHDGQAPTCTEAGFEPYDTCARCDHSTYAELPSVGHTSGEWVTVTEPTDTTEGIRTKSCTVCGEEIEREFIPVIVPDATPGDATGDGKINLTDVSLILKYIAKWDITLNEEVADVNNDSKINLTDVSLILKYIAKWDVELV